MELPVEVILRYEEIGQAIAARAMGKLGLTTQNVGKIEIVWEIDPSLGRFDHVLVKIDAPTGEDKEDKNVKT